MERSEILDIVMRQVSANVHLPQGTTIDPSRPMLEQGIQSLDAVEITHGVVRALKIKMPVSEMTRLRSIDELVDLLHSKLSAKKQEKRWWK